MTPPPTHSSGLADRLADWADMSGPFMPHGHCYLWEPAIFWEMLLGDLAHVIVYFALAGMLGRLAVRRLRPEIAPLREFLAMFATFIGFCGLTHLFNIIVIWAPLYDVQSQVVGTSGLVSLVTLGWIVVLRKRIIGLVAAEDTP